MGRERESEREEVNQAPESTIAESLKWGQGADPRKKLSLGPLLIHPSDVTWSPPLSDSFSPPIRTFFSTKW